MTTRHLAARAYEHLVLAGPQKSAIKEHLRSCAICREEKYTVNSFQILKSCHTEYETKIHVALLIKKLATPESWNSRGMAGRRWLPTS